ncbi:hypothetical protein NA57DRAFT_54031 [Rhizodiscina lignyota]|uniref:Uncharacterized protein n=1 Tax=Rhizodiscina lignyota TaxID=1504668 RepID=A0A9P4MC59_9PEZI|nr:hypothetical protein NA57DRAFT_54031 [Rhizodiscina lignyota]
MSCERYPLTRMIEPIKSPFGLEEEVDLPNRYSGRLRCGVVTQEKQVQGYSHVDEEKAEPYPNLASTFDFQLFVRGRPPDIPSKGERPLLRQLVATEAHRKKQIRSKYQAVGRRVKEVTRSVFVTGFLKPSALLRAKPGTRGNLQWSCIGGASKLIGGCGGRRRKLLDETGAESLVSGLRAVGASDEDKVSLDKLVAARRSAYAFQLVNVPFLACRFGGTHLIISFGALGRPRYVGTYYL